MYHSVLAPAVEFGGVVAQEVVHALLGSHHCVPELGLVVDLSRQGDNYLLPVFSASSRARLKLSLPSSKFFLVLEIMPSLRHPSISPLESFISEDSFRYFSTNSFILSLFSERSLVPILPMFPIATDCPVRFDIWMECFSAFWKQKMLFFWSPRRSQHRPKLIEARNLPFTSASPSCSLWYSIAFSVKLGSASPSSWQSTPMQLQARASPWLSLMLLQTCRNLRQYSTAFLYFLMLSQSTPMEQQDRPSSRTFPALLHPKASISQSFSRLMTVTQVELSIFSSSRAGWSWAVLLSTDCSSAARVGVLKKRGSSMRWGWEGAMDRLLRCLLKLLTSFSSANDPPILKDLLRLPWWLLKPLRERLSIIKILCALLPKYNEQHPSEHPQYSSIHQYRGEAGNWVHRRKYIDFIIKRMKLVRRCQWEQGGRISPWEDDDNSLQALSYFGELPNPRKATNLPHLSRRRICSNLEQHPNLRTLQKESTGKSLKEINIRFHCQQVPPHHPRAERQDHNQGSILQEISIRNFLVGGGAEAAGRERKKKRESTYILKQKFATIRRSMVLMSENKENAAKSHRYDL